MANMTLMIKVNDPHCQNQLRVSHDDIFGASMVIPFKYVACYRADKLKFAGGKTDGQLG